MSEKYIELVEKLIEVGIFQLEDDWAVEIRDLVAEHGVFEGEEDE